LGNPVSGDDVTVEINGAKGENLEMDLVNMKGQIIGHQSIDEAGNTQKATFKLGKEVGTYFLRTVSPTERSTVKIIRN
jgi:hypothetical protein